MKLKKLLFPLIILMLIGFINFASASVFWNDGCETFSSWSNYTFSSGGTVTNTLSTDRLEESYSFDMYASTSSAPVVGTELTNLTGYTISNFTYYLNFYEKIDQITSNNPSLNPKIVLCNNLQSGFTGVGVFQNSSGFSFCILSPWTGTTYGGGGHLQVYGLAENYSQTVRNVGDWYNVTLNFNSTGKQLIVNGTSETTSLSTVSLVNPSMVLVQNLAYVSTSEAHFDYINLGTTSSTPTYEEPTPSNATTPIDMTQIPTNLANALGVTVTAAGLLAAAFLCLILILPGALFTKNVFVTLIMGILGLSASVALTWLPIWTLLVIVLMIALLFAGQMRDWITGK